MKKIIAIAAALVCFAAVAVAQPKAIGARITYGAELSYQHYAGGANFFEFDLGLFTNQINSTVIYDFNLVSANNFNIYAGPGAFIGFHPQTGTLSAGAVAQIGFEYLFPTIPLEISLDWRPHFHLMHGFGFVPVGAGLGIRYKF